MTKRLAAHYSHAEGRSNGGHELIPTTNRPGVPDVVLWLAEVVLRCLSWQLPRYEILVCVDPLAPLRTVGGRLAPPTEALAQAIAERVLGLVVGALDLNALLAEIDLNATLEQVDLGQGLDRVDVDQVLDRVDVNQVLDRVDLDSLLARVDVEGIL